MSVQRLAVGITGATGVIYGVRLLEVLRELGIETHLVVTAAARRTLELETGLARGTLEGLATKAYAPDDLAAPLASGSFPVDAMAVVPCSIKSLSAIAHSYGDNLLTRAADVALKEGRPLVLVPRETPLHKGHLQLLLRAAELGARLVPPMVAFYHRPQTLADVVDHTVGKVLDVLGIPNELFPRWRGA